MVARNGCTTVRFGRRALAWDRLFHVKHNTTKGSTVETCEDIVECPGCSNEMSEGEGVTVTDSSRLPYGYRRQNMLEGQYCLDCLTVCASCDYFVESENAMHDPISGEPNCSDCWFESWTFCDNCGDTMSHERSHYDERAGYTVCSDCYEPASEGQEGLPVHRCPLCSTYNVHFHLLSERYVCDCVAATVPVAYLVRANTLQTTLTNA